MAKPTEQDILVGKHPSDDEVFSVWLDCEDTVCTETRRHRSLSEISGSREAIIEKLADFLINHHMSKRKYVELETKKKILEKYEFEAFAEKIHIFPNADKTRKGNIAEVILSEYLQSTSEIDILVYKLRYNPNIDQSMKGDDVLLVNEKKILLGESKYRGTVNNQVVDAVSKSFSKQLTLPISLSFISDRLFDDGKYDLAAKISKIEEELPVNDFDVVNIGFILSDFSAYRSVEKNMNSSNRKFIIITLNIENSVEVVNQAFEQAKERLKGDFEYEC